MFDGEGVSTGEGDFKGGGVICFHLGASERQSYIKRLKELMRTNSLWLYRKILSYSLSDHFRNCL